MTRFSRLTTLILAALFVSVYAGDVAWGDDLASKRVIELRWKSYPKEVQQVHLDSWGYQVKEAVVKDGFGFRLSPSKKSASKAFRDVISVTVIRHFRGYKIQMECFRDLENTIVAKDEQTVLFLNAVPLALMKSLKVVITPLGRLKKTGARTAKLSLLGSSGARVKKGDVFRVARRRKGRARGKTLAWTYFEATNISGDGRTVLGTLHSGKLWSTDERRFEDFAVPLQVDPTIPLQLLLVDRQEGRALRGYQIYQKREKNYEYVGVTDGRGRLTLRFKSSGIQTLQIRFNSLILARFPVVAAKDWADRVMTLRLKRREDLSKYHIELSRIRQQIEDLILLREVALEDVQQAINDRKYVYAQKVLETFQSEAKHMAGLKRQVKTLNASARSAKQDISAFVERLEKQIERDEKRLDVTLVAAQLNAMKDRVLARKKSEKAILEANTYLAKNNVSMALAKLRQACLADPTWETPKQKLESLERRWKVNSSAHRKARDLMLVCADWDWKNIKSRFGELKRAVAELKNQRDELALRGALRILTKHLTKTTDDAKTLLSMNRLQEAKQRSQVSLELGPLVDEISAFLKSLNSDKS
ncbi:MAG: hypothetical protein P1V97_23335 [Planctomycetota bacterium]|nr:hypothetical protein [Planctomycetota bacterium]